MKIIVDADACPSIHIIHTIAQKNSIELILVSDYTHNFDYQDIKHIVVPAGDNLADYKILSIIDANDILLTQDYALASMALAKNAFVINPFGKIYTSQNIDALLAQRHLHRIAKIRGEKLKGHKLKKRTNVNDSILAQTLENLILDLSNHNI